MKRFIAIATVILSSSAFAQKAPEKDGFSGDVLFGPIVINTSSNTNSVNDDNQFINDLSQTPETINRVVPGVLGNVYYTFDNTQQQVYIGLGMSRVVNGNFAPEIGYKFFSGKYQSFTVAYIPNLIAYDTWKDPYLTEQNRSTTKQRYSGLRFRAENFWGPLSLEAGYGKADIDNDRAGESLSLSPEEQQRLQRSGNIGLLSLDLTIPLAKGLFFRPGIYGFSQNADGDANDFQTYGGELGFVFRRNQHSLIVNLAYEEYGFNTVDPVFNQERDFKEYRFFGTYFYKEPFGLKDFSIFILAVSKNKQSNIDFYAEESNIFGTGLKYDF